MSSSSSFGSGVAFGTSPLGTAPFYDVASLISGILRVTGHGSPDGETTKRAAILTSLNNKYQEICLGRNWRWLLASYDYSFVAPIESETDESCYIENGSDELIGVGTTFSANIQAKDLAIIGNLGVAYHVSTIDSVTQITLETDWSEDTIEAADATSFVFARNQYKLPKETDQILNITIDGQKVSTLVYIGKDEFRKLQGRSPTLLACPRYYTISRRDTDDDFQYIEVWPTPDRDYNCHIDYTVRILSLEDSDDCYPIIPDRYRACLYYATLAEFYYTVMRDSANGDRAFRDYQNFYTRMANDKWATDDTMQILPARKYVRPRSRRYRVSMDAETFGKLDD